MTVWQVSLTFIVASLQTSMEQPNGAFERGGSDDDFDARDLSREEWDESASLAVSASSEQVTIAKQETKDVVRLKLLVLLVLIISAGAVASFIYLYLKWVEEKAFCDEFHDHADKILQSVGSTVDNILGSFDSLAVSTISLARATNQTWPFVTLPDFAVRMSKVLPLSRTFVMQMLPLVTPSQRDEWEAYTVQNDYWVNESIEVQREFQNYYGPTDYDTESYGTIHGDFEDIPANER
jgi:hypothetical protein